MTLYVVQGPPAGGKSTWVQDRAREQDVVIDYDLLAVALSGPGGDGHTHGQAVKTVTKAARNAAIAEAVKVARQVDVYLIHSNPGAQRLAWYRAEGAQVITIDPGRVEVTARVRRDRPKLMLRVLEEWYAEHPEVGAPRPPTPGRASRSW